MLQSDISSMRDLFMYHKAKFVSDKYDKLKSRYPGSSLKKGSLTIFVEEKGIPLVGQKTKVYPARYEFENQAEFTLFTDVRKFIFKNNYANKVAG
jgi:hypothetical protein